MYIVQGEKSQPEDLVGHEQVPDVGTGEPGARRAPAHLVNGPWIGSQLRSPHVEPTGAGEGGAVPSHPRRRNAVEEVDAARDTLDEVLREPHAHQVSRVILRQ